MRLPNEPVKQTCPDINRLQKTIKETEISDLEDIIYELEKTLNENI